ncbi:hypothetical protein GOEFS_086_00080 [Gordonia effusa NBRC 100432]|uniref:Helix-turn-helix domain-containing protein n=1 Tax=Gordonia effusa NBRC 100432 TaxID=1077974 RepID=H0R2Y8_9ACTN|nr:helix-turn-helix domain-containing protein [Gordonia effusa]GAB19439.1 hypothetical protein GOEFS_086_00080 [Gordonia effusa NBRC 100432]
MKQSKGMRIGYRPAEIAAGTGFSLRTIQRKIADGELVAHRCGKAILVYPQDLDAWLDSLPTVVDGAAA